MVWTHSSGTEHRLRETDTNSEDSGGAGSIADALYQGSSVSNLNVNSDGNSLEITVYSETLSQPPFVPGGVEVGQNWLHLPPGAAVGFQFRLLFVSHHGTFAESNDIADYDAHVQFEAKGQSKGIPGANDITQALIRRVGSQFKAVACTANVNARDHAGMSDPFGVAIHWLDGGWEDRDTQVAQTYSEFFSGDWNHSAKGAYVTGNTAYFNPDSHKVFTGCLADGTAHPMLHMGNTSSMGVVVGTPNHSTDNLAALGPKNASTGKVTYHANRYLPIYGISPIFTVVE